MKENFYHNASKTAYLNLLKSGKAKHNSKGEIIRDAVYQKRKCKSISRIEPSRTWFNNTKTITENELTNFRNNVKTKSVYEVLLSQGKVPYSLLEPKSGKKKKADDYEDVFGKKATRKKPKLDFKDINELAKRKNEQEAIQEKTKDENKIDSEDLQNVEPNYRYIKGQSKRIWNELYKVIDSSDVLIHVLDARDPIGTKCPSIEKYLKQAQHKHLIYLINKVDLVPTSVTSKWLRILSKERPVVAFHSTNLNNFYGRNNLMNLLRQFANLHKEKKEISVGFLGFPNVGKSSIINILRNKKVCSVAPIPGQTKVWQYISLSGNIYAIDCPGIVPFTDEKEAVLRGAIRIENVDDPEFYVNEIVKKATKPLEKVYGIKIVDLDDFLEKLAVRFGKLLKNGEKDTKSVAKIVLHDWCKGKIPYFVEPIEEESK